jgi:hypothetical protein
MLRVSMGLFAVISLVAMLIAYLLQPFVFAIGVWFVDSFAHSFVNAAVNTPIIAYAGLSTI